MQRHGTGKRYGVVVLGIVSPLPYERGGSMGKRLARQVDGTRWKGSALTALQYLALEADEKTGIVRGVGLQKIADQIGLSWQRTKAVMRVLRSGGVVETLHRGGGRHVNVYKLHLDFTNNGTSAG